MSSHELLRAANITKFYGGVCALKDVSFAVSAGEVHALVGENGAGKSTLIKILTGAVAADSGQVILEGKVIEGNSPRLAKLLGIEVIYQQPTVFHGLTVAENIAAGLERQGVWTRVDWKTRYRRAAELLEQIGAEIDPEADAGELTMPQQQLMEIARALGSKAKVLILDEPTASLSEKDTETLFRVLRQLRTQGVGIIYISHRLDELSVIADRATVLRDGSLIATHSMAEIGRQELIRLMVGRELSAVFPKKTVPLREVVLELRQVKCYGAESAGVDLALRGGEILGLAGLVGAGRTELAETVFGLRPLESGQILLRGNVIQVRNPAEAIQHGIAYLPEDRRRHGVIPQMSISANITLASLKSLVRLGSVDSKLEAETAIAYVQRFAIKAPAIFTAVSSLSGGNQQKVVLSRWLATRPAVLILDEPTQGVDVGAKAEIHALMSDLAAEGMAILMISSELPELLGMCDRIAVMRTGAIAGFLDRKEATQHDILALALGHPLAQPASQEQGSGLPG
jgi:rhamnose transport system ATP-binding protein